VTQRVTAPEPDDADLVRRARAGSRDAFEALCTRYRRQVLRIAYLESGSGEGTGDIAQNTFLAALTAIGALREPARFSGWLAGIVRNQARMWRRSSRARAEDHALPPDLPDPATAPWSQATALDVALALGEAISRLRPERAAALHLHYWQGYTTAETAALLGVAPGTIKRWLHESRQTIRQEMIRMGTAPLGAPRKGLAALIARDADWDQIAPITEALARADCETLVNPDPIPEDVAAVVLDYEVEGGKGVEWLVYLRQTRAGLPVVMLGPSAQRTMYACWAAGADVYLTVPFDVDELAAFVPRAIEAAGARRASGEPEA